MYETKVFESGNCKVICEALVFENNTVQNCVSFYEKGALIVFAKLMGKKYVEFNKSDFRKMNMYNKIQDYLVKGVAAFSVEEHIREGSRAYWTYVIFLSSGIECECCKENYYMRASFLFTVKNNIYIARLNYNSKIHNMNFAEINKLHKEDFYLEFTDIVRRGERNTNYVYQCNEFTFDTYPDVYSRAMKKENLMKNDFFKTGNIFKIRDDDAKKLAKQKLVTGKMPFLLAIDSEGYAIFDGIR